MINLNKREKLLLKILIGFASAMALYFLIIDPLVTFKMGTESESETNRANLEKLNSIYETYRSVKDKKAKYESLLRRNKGVTTLIEEYATEVGILNNKVYTRDNPGPTQNKFKKLITDVKFEGVSIVPMLEFIYKMENSGQLITISYIRINQALKGRDIYDVAIKFESISLE